MTLSCAPAAFCSKGVWSQEATRLFLLALGGTQKPHSQLLNPVLFQGHHRAHHGRVVTSVSPVSNESPSPFFSSSAHGSALDPYSPCNNNCECQTDSFTPVCGADGITYLSACFAGCNSTVIENLGMQGRRQAPGSHSCSWACQEPEWAIPFLLLLLWLWLWLLFLPCCRRWFVLIHQEGVRTRQFLRPLLSPASKTLDGATESKNQRGLCICSRKGGCGMRYSQNVAGNKAVYSSELPTLEVCRNGKAGLKPEADCSSAASLPRSLGLFLPN